MRRSLVEHIMGMPIIVEVCDPEVDEQAVERAFAWLRFVDATFSTYRPDSEVSRLNRGEIGLDEAHAAVRSVLGRCERLRELTGGYFDVRAPYLGPGTAPAAGRGGPGSIDPSGLVKGWSVLGAGRLLDRAGARNYAINAGGDVLLRGHPPGTDGWRVGIQHPRRRDQIAMVLSVADAAVATSGAYERGEHIVDPHTGRPPDGVLSVTVVGPDLASADAYATAAYAMGPDGAGWCAGLDGYEAIVMRTDDTVLTTPGLDRLRV
ncbi:MAG: FAD:protein transferase [Solirubrobacteraceae bacterium]|nr:FAD:protein transferase [Solirubrobacteraceae bacterium]